MVRWLFDFFAKAKRSPQSCRPSHENLPGKLLNLKKRFAEAYSPNRSIGNQLVRHVQQCVVALDAAIQLKISLGFLSAPHLLPATAHMVIIMFLMNYWRYQRRIHHWQILLSHSLDQPVVKPQPPDREIWNLRIHLLWENEYVDPGMVLVLAMDAGPPFDSFFPRYFEIELFDDTQINALGDH